MPPKIASSKYFQKQSTSRKPIARSQRHWSSTEARMFAARSLDDMPPSWSAQIGFHLGGSGAELGQTSARLFQHERGEVEAQAGRLRECLQDGGQDDGVAAAQVQHAARRPRRQTEDAQK